MTVTLRLPPDVEDAIGEEARLRGVSPDELISGVLLARPVFAGVARHDLPPEEWIREFQAWVQSHEGARLPVLSDEAMSREFIYGDRGL